MTFPAYPEYKDSGVEWLGEVPTHWMVVRGKNLFRNRRESARSDDEQLAATQKYGVVPQARFMEAEQQKVTLALTGTENFRHLESGDFVISLRSFQGGVEYSEWNGCVSPAYTVMVPASTVERSYFRHLLKSKGFISFLSIFSEGIRDGKTINYTQFASVDFPLPELEEQKKIGIFLDHETARIDALIEEQQRLIELLKEKRQAVISHAVTKGLDPDVPMKDSGVEWLGEVPAHWDIKKLSVITDKITNGYVGPTRDLFVDDGVPYLQSLHIKNNSISFSPPYYVPKEWSDLHEKSILKSGDVLVVQTGDIGQVAVVPEGFPEANCHALIVVSPIRRFVSGPWLAWVLNSDYGYNSLLSIKTGALHPHLNCGYLKDLYAPVPPVEEQNEIVRYILIKKSEVDELVLEAHKGISLLKERRSALISAAVTGKIDVRGWEPPVPHTESPRRAATELPV